MTLENLYFFLTGTALTSLGVYMGYLLSNLKNIANAKTSEELKASVGINGSPSPSINPSVNPSMAPSAMAPTATANLLTTAPLGSAGTQWSGPHFPRLENMF
jgi:hypothetical protein